MKKNDTLELKSKSEDELKRKLADLRDEVSRIYTEFSQGKVKNMNELKYKKKDIARVMTFLSMRAREAKGKEVEA